MMESEEGLGWAYRVRLQSFPFFLSICVIPHNDDTFFNGPHLTDQHQHGQWNWVAHGCSPPHNMMPSKDCGTCPAPWLPFPDFLILTGLHSSVDWHLHCLWRFIGHFWRHTPTRAQLGHPWVALENHPSGIIKNGHTFTRVNFPMKNSNIIRPAQSLGTNGESEDSCWCRKSQMKFLVIINTFYKSTKCKILLSTKNDVISFRIYNCHYFCILL